MTKKLQTQMNKRSDFNSGKHEKYNVFFPVNR